jgi:hypothetical protein
VRRSAAPLLLAWLAPCSWPPPLLLHFAPVAKAPEYLAWEQQRHKRKRCMEECRHTHVHRIRKGMQMRARVQASLGEFACAWGATFVATLS